MLKQETFKDSLKPGHLWSCFLSLVSIHCSSPQIFLDSPIQIFPIQLIAMNFKFDVRSSLIGKSREPER